MQISQYVSQIDRRTIIAFLRSILSNLSQHLNSLLILSLIQKKINLDLIRCPLILSLLDNIQLYYFINCSHKSSQLFLGRHTSHSINSWPIINQIDCRHTLDLQSLSNLSKSIYIQFHQKIIPISCLSHLLQHRSQFFTWLTPGSITQKNHWHLCLPYNRFPFLHWLKLYYIRISWTSRRSYLILIEWLSLLFYGCVFLSCHCFVTRRRRRRRGRGGEDRERKRIEGSFQKRERAFCEYLVQHLGISLMIIIKRVRI